MGSRTANPHFHRTISESFFVIAGTIKLYDGTQWIDAKAGDFLFVPEGGSTDSGTSRATTRRC